jgi:uncharacterized protein
MILYLDTSCLVKLYFEEEDSLQVREQVQSSSAAATSLIAYAEVRSALARRFREKAFPAAAYKRVLSGFCKDWPHYLRVQVTEPLVTLAGDLAEKHGLRGFDAVHLASAMTLREASSSNVLFSCADRPLQTASREEGFAQPPP